jgi:hypothetical protein
LTFGGTLLKLSVIDSLTGFDIDDYWHNTASSQPSPADQRGHAGIFVLELTRVSNAKPDGKNSPDLELRLGVLFFMG